jgi:2-phosphoglycerate kinase
MRVDDGADIAIERDESLPYSKGLTAQSLMATGLSPEYAWRIAAALEGRLAAQGRSAIHLSDLDGIAREMLGAEAGAALLRRLEQWRRVRTLEKPLIILIGGTTGVGKSTLANLLANRLGIVRVASTDMVREVMRAFFAKDLMPAIHSSSFDCAGAVRIPVMEGTDLTRAGFIEQVKSVRVGIEALVARAIAEKQGLIVEGVHLVPGFLDKARWGDALVVELVMAVPDARRHRAHFTTRDWHTGGVRPLRRYLKHFVEIRHVQDLILEAATAFRVRVIQNDTIDDAVKEALDEVLDVVAR